MLSLNSSQLERFNTYNKTPNLCVCTQPLAFNKRNNTYCSRSCAAISNNKKRSIEERERRSTTLKNSNKIKREAGLAQKMCHVSFCLVCKATIKNKHRKTCSKICLDIYSKESKSKGGRKSAEKRNKRSKDEIKLFELCLGHYKNVTSNDISITGGWDADILIHDFKVAILWNGPWHYKEMSFNNHSLKQIQNRDRIKKKEFESVGWCVEIFEDRHFTPTQAFEYIRLKYYSSGRASGRG